MNGNRLKLVLFVWGMLLVSSIGMAMGPHEVAVIVNARSPASVMVAKEYARLRHIPEINLIEVALPEKVGLEDRELAPDIFTQSIWVPVWKTLKQRKIDSQILAWAYSVDFPVRIASAPNVSITGLTFVRNRLPKADAIENGHYLSPLFAGPDGPGKRSFGSQSLDHARNWLGDDMPLPAMMLGVIGHNGNTTDEVLRALQRSAADAAGRPEGTIYYVTNSDIRSLCRAWQYPAAVHELKAMGVEVEVVSAFPERDRPAMGMMVGKAHLPDGIFSNLRPGSVADHLTSCAAVFGATDQTRLTAWVKAGVAATSGTVVEPMSIWAKFPNARFFVHYASGCTTLESFTLAVRCPLQLLLVGDPLAAPWAQRTPLWIEGLPGDCEPGEITFHVAVGRGTPVYTQFTLLVDGRQEGPSRGLSEWRVDPGQWGIGRHNVRVVAVTIGPVRQQNFVEQVVTVHPRISTAGK